MVIRFPPLPIVRFRFTFRSQSSVYFGLFSTFSLRRAFEFSFHQMVMGGVNKYHPREEINGPVNDVLQAISQKNPKSGSLLTVIPYVIEIDSATPETIEAGEPFVISIVLMGKALNHLSLIILAWVKLFASGWGKAKIRAELESVHREIAPGELRQVFHHGSSAMEIFTPFTQIESSEPIYDAVVSLQTPLRFRQKQPGPATEIFTATDLWMAAIARLEILSEALNFPMPVFEKDRLAEQVCALPYEKKLCWHSKIFKARYSSGILKLTGISGSLSFPELPVYFGTILKFAELVHLGKNTGYGMGKIALETQKYKSCKS